jgi:hypothetical protein
MIRFVAAMVKHTQMHALHVVPAYLAVHRVRVRKTRSNKEQKS